MLAINRLSRCPAAPSLALSDRASPALSAPEPASASTMSVSSCNPARTITAAIRGTTGERDLSVGIVASLQTHGSLANWHPHLHLVVTDGGFRPDGRFVRWPVHDVARLTEAFFRAVLRLFVRRELFDPDRRRPAQQLRLAPALVRANSTGSRRKLTTKLTTRALARRRAKGFHTAPWG